MPTDTFFNLPESKRNDFINVALKEFARSPYESASINKIIKNVKMARGSVYQYFTDKLDLWLYLKDYSENIKLQYINQINRSEYDSFWDYYKALFLNGINFDLECPYCSQLLYRINFKEGNAALLPYLHSWKLKAQEVLTQWVEYEKEVGSFNKQISTDIIVHVLVTLSLSVAELLQNKYHVNLDENMNQNKPLFGNNREELTQAVNELVFLFEKSLN